MKVIATGLVLLTLIVDQIEGEVAVVETATLDLSWLPLELLPQGLQEGDQLEIRIQRVERRPPSEGRPSTRRAQRPAPKPSRPVGANGE